MRSIAIIGIGRMGGALAIALDRAGFDVAELVHRGTDAVSKHLKKPVRTIHWDSFDRLDSEVVLIASDDPNIPVIAERLSEIVSGRIVLQTSGSLSSSVLTVAKGSGYAVGSMHPLISISDSMSGADSFAGAYFCVEGDDEAVKAAEEIAKGLGGSTFSIAAEDKPLYHAAAVTACGHLVALIDTAVEILSKCGLKNDEAKEVLSPLIESTISNLHSQTSENALTGSFARGDTQAVKRHLEAFEGRVSPHIREIYLDLGRRSVEIAGRRGSGPEAYKDLTDLISMAKQKSGC